MSDVDQLLAGILADPDDEALRLVVADWLEEQGDEACDVRAELVRLQVARGREEQGTKRDAIDFRAREIIRKHRPLLGPLRPLVRWHGLRPAAPLLAIPSLPLFLGAPLADAHDGPLVRGSVWVGHLHQSQHSIPTTLRIRKRRHNHVEGDMVEDLSAVHGRHSVGTFLFRGFVVGRDHLLFVTYMTREAGVWPGLYELRLGRGDSLAGSWWVPAYGLRGQVQLRRG